MIAQLQHPRLEPPDRIAPAPFRGDAAVRVEYATAEVQFDSVRELMHAFVTWLFERYRGEKAFIEGYFDPEKFERELAELPGEYAPPTGRLLLAELGGNPVGCVALRNLGHGFCEMKRLFVKADCHGAGVGRILVQTLIREARMAGYRAMRLDTGYKQIEAHRLYRKFGFTEIDPYYDPPAVVKNRLLFMERGLQDGHGQARRPRR